MPANVTYQQAAPSTEGAHYALAHIRAAKIRSGQNILVYGATGSIGSAAVQLLKALGANVTAVCDTDHMELVRGLGADRVIDYTAEDFTKDEQRYDVILDSVGRSSFSQCKRLLKQDESTSRRNWVLWPKIRSVRSSARCMAARRSCSPFRSTTS
jgi:NADPH:quinone reductase-like Zn-dependent oxidoreductase